MQRLIIRGVILLLVFGVGLIGGAIFVAQLLSPAAPPAALMTPTPSVPVTLLPNEKDPATAATSATPTLDPALDTPVAVLFPPGSDAAGHTFFPLNGQHATLDCATCHPAGRYRGTARACETCHQADKPTPHFTGTCGQCHSETGWLPATVDHSTLTDCLGCHTPERPANHFSGQCSLCHSTTAWRPATFNHSTIGQTDCAACHTPPANHYSGACRNCHTNTSDWRDVHFDHTGFTDCRACHTAPAGHYTWQCSACHTPGAWRPANFNHSFPMSHGNANSNCASCHVGETSAWTCANCHNGSELNEEHTEDGIFDFANRCLDCHADGREGHDRWTTPAHVQGAVVWRLLWFVRRMRP